MNRLLPLYLIFLLACGSEKGIELAKPSTFVRYYNGGYNDEAKLIKETPDGGFIILSNGAKDGTGQFLNEFGAKVIKIDVYGNPVWQSVFFETKDIKTADVGKDLLILANGYLLLGASNIVVMDLEGKTVARNSLSVTDAFPKIDFGGNDGEIAGASIAINNIAPNNYLVTGIRLFRNVNGVRTVDNTMFLGEIDKNTFKWVWLNGQGKANGIVNKLFLDANNRVYWTSPVSVGTEKISLLQIPQRTTSTSAGSIGANGFNQTPSDLSRFGNGFVIAGTTDEKGGKDICYYFLNQSAALSGDSKVISITATSDNKVEVKPTPSPAVLGQVVFQLSGDQVANSIYATQDGGLIILGTGDASELPGYEKKGNGQEYMLFKVDGFGNMEPGWPKYYGSKSTDQGASVIQASDGSFMVLGTTDFGSTKTIFLMKTDKNGEIL
jgi:hypothetical protein